MHFWDPMKNQYASTVERAPSRAAFTRGGRTFIITAIMTTTRMRGASG
jgi:hypothetical protein